MCFKCAGYLLLFSCCKLMSACADAPEKACYKVNKRRKVGAELQDPKRAHRKTSR